MYVKGVNATTLDDVRAASNTSKSQLYNHFADKEELVRAVAAERAAQVLERERGYLQRLKSFQGLVRWRTALVQRNALQNGAYGCALGSMASELSDQDEQARSTLAEAFAEWEGLLAAGLRRMRDSGVLRPEADPDKLATGLMAALQGGYLLAETAHDLRTPVAALRALAETALRNPTQRGDLLPRTVRLAARMGSIIDGLLVRARLAAGVERLAAQPVWLDQLVAGVVEETPADGASVTLTAAPCKVMADATLLQRAVGNLLDNALRYGRQPDQPAIVHITVANGRVTVADHGPGVDGEFMDEAFDRFRTGSGSSGLGLSIVRWVATAHGGTLSVYNAEDAGAIFELTLPVIP